MAGKRGRALSGWRGREGTGGRRDGEREERRGFSQCPANEGDGRIAPVTPPRVVPVNPCSLALSPRGAALPCVARQRRHTHTHSHQIRGLKTTAVAVEGRLVTQKAREKGREKLRTDWWSNVASNLAIARPSSFAYPPRPTTCGRISCL